MCTRRLWFISVNLCLIVRRRGRGREHSGDGYKSMEAKNNDLEANYEHFSLSALEERRERFPLFSSVLTVPAPESESI